MPSRKQFADLDMQNASKVINNPDPTNPGDLVNLQYLTNFVEGKSWKQPVRVAVASNVNISSPGSSLDGVAFAGGDANKRVLLYGQSTGAENGIYDWNGAASAMTRSSDANSTGDLQSGTTVAVLEGTTNANKNVMLTAPDTTITIGSTATTWTPQNLGGTTYTAGNGLTGTTTFSVLANGSSIDVSASGVKIAAAAAGAGLTESSGVLSVGAGTGITVNADTIQIDTSVTARHSSALFGNGSATSFLLPHNRNNQWVLVQVIEVATGDEVMARVSRTDANNVTIEFQSAPALNAYRVIVVG